MIDGAVAGEGTRLNNISERQEGTLKPDEKAVYTALEQYPHVPGADGGESGDVGSGGTGASVPGEDLI